MGETKHDPRTWGTTGTWVVEPRDEAIARTPAFGQRFFQTAFREFMSVADGVYFLRWSEQSDHVYAVFALPSGGAGVQIDPDLEYIIVWGGGGQAEYGDWGADQVPPAMAHLRRLITGKGDPPGVEKSVN